MAAVNTNQPQYTAQQATIVTEFNSDLYVRTQMDVQQTPLYDTITIAAGNAVNVSSSAFFTNVGSNSGKGLWQTNLLNPNTLISPEAFSIRQFRFRWSEDITRADLTSLLNGFVLEFSIGIKVYQRAPIWLLPAGGGISGFSTRTAESAYVNGWPASMSARTLWLPLVISSKANFGGVLNGNALTLSASGTGLTAMLLCEGLYARGVQ